MKNYWYKGGNKIKKVITAILNNSVNEELRKDPEIKVIGKDLLYQEAVLEVIEENEDIDYILLNDELPGEEITEFIKKISKVKIIIFTEKSTKNEKINLEKNVYKVFQNGEVSIEEIKNIIKERNYTEELEKEIEKLRNIIYEKENTKYSINKIIKIKKEKRENKIISIAGFESIAKTIFIINLINSINTKENKIILINMNILNSEIEETFKRNISSKAKIIKSKEFLFENNEIVGKEKIINEIENLKKEYDYIIINNNAECYFELNQALMEKSNQIYFIIEKNIRDIKISNNLINLYEKNWNLKLEKIKVLLVNINIRKNKIKNITIEIFPYKENKRENEIIYKKPLIQRKIYKKLIQV